MTHQQHKTKTLSIGGATFDLFVHAQLQSAVHDGKDILALPLGGKIRVDQLTGTCGGGAANTSVGLSRLGCDASFAGIIADDQWGQQILQNLLLEGVNTDAATIVEHETASCSLVLIAASGERVLLNHAGTNRHLHDTTFDREIAGAVDWVYLNRTHDNAHMIHDDLIKMLTVEPHPALTWNPGGGQIEAGIKEKNNSLLVGHCSLLLLNKEEALAFSGKRTMKEALHTLSGLGASIVCITDGKNGASATDGTQLWHCPTIDGSVVDTTGAGDAFGTGMTWALRGGKDLPTALKAGTINAMSVVGALGAQQGLLTHTEIHSKLEATNLAMEVHPL